MTGDVSTTLRASESLLLTGQVLAEEYLAEHDGDTWTSANIAEGSVAFANSFLTQLIFGTVAFGVRNWERGYDVLDQTGKALSDGFAHDDSVSQIYYNTSVAFGTTYAQGVKGLVYDDILCGLGRLGLDLLTLKYRAASEIQDGSFFEQSPARAANEVFGPLVAGNMLWFGAQSLVRAALPAGVSAEAVTSTTLVPSQPAAALTRVVAGAEIVPLSEGVELIIPPKIPVVAELPGDGMMSAGKYAFPWRGPFRQPTGQMFEQVGRGLWREVEQPGVALREISPVDAAVEELLAPELESYPLVLRQPAIEVDAAPTQVARMPLLRVAPRSGGIVEPMADIVDAGWVWGMPTTDSVLGNPLVGFVGVLQGGRSSWDLGGIFGTAVTNRPLITDQEGSLNMETSALFSGFDVGDSSITQLSEDADDANMSTATHSIGAVRHGVVRPEDHIIRVIGKIVLNEEQRRRLEALGVRFIATDNPDRTDTVEIRSRIGDATIVLNNISTPIDGQTMRDSPNLRFIQTWSTGTDNIDLETARALGIHVASVPGYSTEAVAEKTLGLMILASNNLHSAHVHAVGGGWDYQLFRGTELKGKTLCIIGRGRIGQRVGELAAAFGMNTILLGSGTSREEMHAAIAQSDFISLHCPHTENTHHLIGPNEFALMRGSILINNSRGGVVDESALLDAIESGNVRFATIDVFETEPPARNNPLLQHPKVYVTPHCAWNTEEAVRNLTDMAISNIERFVRGELKEFIE